VFFCQEESEKDGEFDESRAAGQYLPMMLRTGGFA